MLLATVPAAPPTRKNQRATSCPAPISAMVPYLPLSRLSARAFCRVLVGRASIAPIVREQLGERNRGVCVSRPRWALRTGDGDRERRRTRPAPGHGPGGRKAL